MSPMHARIIIFAEPSNHIEMLSEALISGGHSVSVAETAETVSRLLKTESWDILIADIGRDGGADMDTLNAVRNAWPGLPVICISSPAERERDFSGDEVLITKPYRINHIEKCIDELLQPPTTGIVPADGAILVVDDDELFRTLLVRSLRLFGRPARQARDGKEALEIMKSETVSAVIADIFMPEIDGVTLLKEIKQTWPHIPVILITGYHASNEWPKGSDTAPDGFLMKPFKIEHIKKLLENVTGRRAGS